MEVQKEAQRIMTLSVWKMYHSRVQRGGMRLHRSLQLSLVMRSARELYLSARLEDEELQQDENEAELELVGPSRAPEGERRESENYFPAVPSNVLEQRAATPACHLREKEDEVGPESAEEAGGSPAASTAEPVEAEPMEEGSVPPSMPAAKRRLARPNRKRRSCTLSRRGAADEAELVPSKKARLGDEREAPPQPQEGAFPSLAKVLQSGIGAVLGAAVAPPGGCGRGEAGGGFSILVRAVVAF